MTDRRVALLCLSAGLAFPAPAQTTRTRNPHGPLTVACESCHTASGWTPIRPRPEFNHQTQTSYPLLGHHENVPCQSCHVKKVFKNTSRECASCHADLHRGQMGKSCDQCHNVRGWNVAVQQTRDHANRFPLLGAHAAAACESCHRGAASGLFKGLSTDCASCHVSDYKKAQSPPHAASRLPLRCEQCHSMDSWAGARFDHAQVTRFPLEGAHARVECRSCHVGGRFQGTPSQCFDCHNVQFSAAQSPNHVAAGFPRDCQVCHTAVQWKGARFDHNTATHFQLTGSHTSVQCVSCHVAGRFGGSPTTCEGCHRPAFEQTKNPDHARGGFSSDCATCHTTVGWKGAKFDHDLSRFRLTGSHVQVECASCHVGGKFTGTPADCWGCHQTAFARTVQPNHATAGFPRDCLVCHTTSQWKGAVFDHSKTQFALTGAHGAVQCQSCHTADRFAGTPKTCDGCHLDAFNKAANPNHVAAGFPKDCLVCHTSVQWKGAVFDHSKTQFALTGAHTALQCAQCHVVGRFAGLGKSCDVCHTDAFNKTSNPNHAAAGFAKDCALCHTTVQWKGAQFDHGRTQFPLTGAHKPAQCASCHVGGKFTGLPKNCDSCHLDAFNKTTNPNHATAGFPKDCTVCHTTLQWSGAQFDHGKTQFPLMGAHAATQCLSCHVGGKFAGLAKDCESCHIDAFNKTTNPNHIAAAFSRDCAICHTVVQWKGAKFDHGKTRFPLTGAHQPVQCAACHVGGRYAGTPLNCDSCHLDAFNKTTNPNHVAAGFARDCAVCHVTSQWKGARFDHGKTQFPLTGAHSAAQCAQCHVGSKYAGVPKNCDSCHIEAFNKTVNPNHAAAGFPKDCAVCHTTAQWKGAKFDHSAMTQFALTGAHSAESCVSCHVGGVFKGTVKSCEGCHLTAFNHTVNPNHVAAGFPKDCAVCHTTAQWKGAKFDHSKTQFPLTGSHTSAQCAQCHVGGKFTGTPKNCDSCHLEAFNKTTNPNHVTAGFPKDCAVCHTTTQWKGAKFDHSKTQFPLTGSHTSAQCAQCHVGGKFTGTPKNCDSCHLEAFNKTTNPNHVTAGFPKDCAVCHTTTQWKGAKFDHSKTQFPLTGSHTSAQCAQCHVGGKFTRDAEELRLVPPGGVQQDHESEPRGRRVPEGLRRLPHDDAVEGREVRPLQDEVPADRIAHFGAVRPVPRRRQVYRGRRRTATRATWTRSTRRRIRTTWPPGSRRTARSATRRRSGRAPSSITPRRSFR